jgi:hypothetical protein
MSTFTMKALSSLVFAGGVAAVPEMRAAALPCVAHPLLAGWQ